MSMLYGMQTNYISASFNPQVPKLQSDEKQISLRGEICLVTQLYKKSVFNY